MAVDALAPWMAQAAVGRLREFNEAGVLSAADVHVAQRICELTGEDDETVMLALALAVRAPRLGHVFVDLATISATATVDVDEPVDVTALRWPQPEGWVAAVRASAVALDGDEDERPAPGRLLGSRLYLDRYWRQERQVAVDLLALGSAAGPDVDGAALERGLTRLFGDGGAERQRAAASAALRRRLTVVAGGPGTGKTTTVGRILALLGEQAAERDQPPPLIALAAPTGKAAARLQEAVHAAAAELECEEAVRGWLLGLRASTLHRLLGRRPGSHSRFAHHRENRLPHEVVVVDETSMISLSLMAQLLEAVRPDARLILVGDPGQLASIEAGVVLGDIVGPAAGGAPAAALGGGEPRLAEGIVVLRHGYRYGGAIARVADAVRSGDGDAAIDALRTGSPEIIWLELDGDEAAAGALAPVRERAVRAGQAVVRAARAGDARQALDALGAFRLLCAHRRGPYGAAGWSRIQQEWLGEALPELELEGHGFPGRPLLVTRNDYELGLYNGDTGVVIARTDAPPVAAFERGGEVLHFSPLRLGAVETLYAMTIHKSQGSQFATAAVLLPAADAPILTRELLYTAVSRAQRELILVATEAAVRTAIDRPAMRASGLRARLWG